MKSTESFLHSEEGRDFLRTRVRQFSTICFSLGMGFFLFRLALLAYLEVGSPFEPSMIAHLAGTLGFGAIALAVTFGPRSLGYVQSVEALGLVVSCVGYEAMGLHLPAVGGWMNVILALTITFVARSIFVPSPAYVTLLLTASAGVPLVYLAHQSHVAHAPLIQELARTNAQLLMGHVGPSSAMTHAIANTATVVAWWLATVALCTFTSRVIYGLRRDAYNAKKLGQYTLEEEIGSGGMGQVYRASHALLRRPCAIKLLTTSRDGESNITRFEREVQLTARLTHPHTITVFDYGRTADGQFYYAMELLDGADLETLVASTGAFEPARVGHVLEQIAGALAEAHGLGLIHRDVKPSNIILSDRGGRADFATILDFGLVKQIDRGTSVTQANVVTGTPLFMSPEMITNPDRLDGRSDLYSLGAVGYYLLTGTHVFGGATPVEVCSHHLHSQPVPPSQRLGRALPRPIEDLILRCLEKDPARRPQSAEEIEHELGNWDGIEEWTSERAREWWTQNEHLRLTNRLGSSPPTEKSHVGRELGPSLLGALKPRLV
jgi:eukaryotic-like serine/threonine-protein kinase